MIARKYRWTKCPKDLEKRVKILVLNWVLQLEGLRLFTRLVSLHFCPCSSARGGRGRSAGVVAQNPYIRSGWRAAEGGDLATGVHLTHLPAVVAAAAVVGGWPG